MELLGFLSLLGTLLGMINGIAPIPGITQNGKKGNFDLIPSAYLYLNHFTQGLWLLYSILIQDPGLILANTLTYLFSGVSLVLYVYYRGQVVTFVPMYGGVALMTASYIPSLLVSSSVGTIAALTSIVAAAAPLNKAKQVYKTRDRSYIDLNLVSTSVASSLTWAVYSSIILDTPNFVSSVIGVILNGVLLSLYFWAGSNHIKTFV